LLVWNVLKIQKLHYNYFPEVSMKRWFISFLLILLPVITFAQIDQSEFRVKNQPGTLKEDDTRQQIIPSRDVILLEDFNGDNTTAGITARGWVWINTDGGGTSSTFNGNTTAFTAYEGPTNGYIGQNYQGANGTYIDQWLISPQFTVVTGDTVSFWWRAPTGAWDDSVFLKISDGGSTIPDFTLNLGRYRVPQGVWTNFKYAFTSGGTKRFAFHYYHTNGGETGLHSNYWGVDYFQVLTGTIFGPGLATNPNPADAAVNVSLSPTLTWVNPSGVTATEVFFGSSPETMVSVYSGAPSTSYAASSLGYYTNYYWRVNSTDGTGTTVGTTWSFRTIQDPLLFIAFEDDFSNGLTKWTVTNDGGSCVWEIFSEPYPNVYLMPPGSSSPVFAADVDECGSGSTLLSTATMANAIDLSLYQSVVLEFDSDWNANDVDNFCYVDVSNDGTNWVNYLTYSGTDVRTTHVTLNISATAALQPNVKVRFKSVQPGWDWFWVIDNVKISAYDIVPVELASFKADVIGNSVTLNWMTATETNNNGFEVERSFNGSSFEKVGFVNGNGTTTEVKSYSFIDGALSSGTYTYRLKQLDFDGTFEYSSLIEVEVSVPSVFELGQNYPNPFNPSTKIDFSLAVDSKVTLRVFDILGQEVSVLLNQNMNAGSHSINFDASKLITGMYIYKLEADGVDGVYFTDIKKMLLVK
jgi:hypothetical protein